LINDTSDQDNNPVSLAVDILDGPPPTILVVDDDPDILRIVQFYLKKQNYTIFTATNGEEAVAALEEQPDIELILSDVMMPKMNGLELLKAVRTNPHMADISLILISAEGQTSKKVAGLDLGADDYITKPFNFDELMARVRNHLRLRRLQREVTLKNSLLKARNDQLTSDLEAARTVQQALMPHVLPENQYFTTGSRYIPLDRVGGDFFDIVLLDGGKKLGVIIADVCGHGVAAAFITAMTKISFRNSCFSSFNPGHVLTQMNQELFSTLQSGFVTAFYGVFDFTAQTLSFSSGGHPPLLIHQKENNQVTELPAQSTFLGFFNEVEFKTDTFPIQKGDRVLFYTDGIYEGTNQSGETFGMERVCGLIKSHADLSIPDQINKLLDGLFDFLGGEKLEDDITLLGLEIL